MAPIDAVKSFSFSHPEKVACTELATNRSWTYKQLHLTVQAVTTLLISKLGANSGKRVVCISKNSPELLILNLACIRCGAVFVPLNWRLSSSEISVLIDDCKPSVVYLQKEFKHNAQFNDGLLIEELLTTPIWASDEPQQLTGIEPVDWEQVSTILYTSGTTGKPKGVMLSEKNCFWSMFNFVTGLNASFDSVFLCDMPMFHTAGLLANSRAAFMVGGQLIMSDGFNAERTLAVLADRDLSVSHYFSVPQMAQFLWGHEHFRPEKLHGLVAYVWGGAPASKSLVEKFVGAGIQVSNGFGMTEAGSVSNVPLGNACHSVNKVDSIGIPSMSIEMAVFDENGNRLACGEVGELGLKGPSITCGYWQQDEATDQAFSNGWFMTGDVAQQDQEGYFFLLDRKKDMYISGGENVYPAEVESCLSQIDQVCEAAVIGVPHQKWGECGIAMIVRVANSNLGVDEVKDHCLKHLAKYKVPDRVIFADSIPRTSSGKVKKNVLKEALRRESP